VVKYSAEPGGFVTVTFSGWGGYAGGAGASELLFPAPYVVASGEGALTIGGVGMLAKAGGVQGYMLTAYLSGATTYLSTQAAELLLLSDVGGPIGCDLVFQLRYRAF
jgi:hypothetical protein